MVRHYCGHAANGNMNMNINMNMKRPKATRTYESQRSHVDHGNRNLFLESREAMPSRKTNAKASPELASRLEPGRDANPGQQVGLKGGDRWLEFRHLLDRKELLCTCVTTIVAPW